MIKTIQRQLILPRQFGLNTQSYFKYFLIFIAWPVFSIGVSITLYLFVFMLHEIKKRTHRSFLVADKSSIRLYLFAFVSILSLVFSPWEKIHSDIFADLQLEIQYIYWILVAVFFINTYKYMNKNELNKYIFYGLILHTIHFFFFNFSSPIPFIRTFVSRNGYVYTILALWPLASGYVYNQYGKSKGNLSLFLVFVVMLLTDGRAGVVIIMIENVFIYFINNNANAKMVRLFLIISIPLAGILGPIIVNEENRQALGDAVTPVSSRIGGFIKGEGADGDLTFDKSWLTRKLMIEKGKEILTDYPFLGVGIGHYDKFSAELSSLHTEEFSRLVGPAYDEAYYNHKSAHNSYVHLASEMGIIGFICLLLVLVPPLLIAIKKLVLLTINQDDLILISLMGICIHFYTITSLPGTVTWFVIGIASSVMNRAKLAK